MCSYFTLQVRNLCLATLLKSKTIKETIKVLKIIIQSFKESFLFWLFFLRVESIIYPQQKNFFYSFVCMLLWCISLLSASHALYEVYVFLIYLFIFFSLICNICFQGFMRGCLKTVTLTVSRSLLFLVFFLSNANISNKKNKN